MRERGGLKKKKGLPTEKELKAEKRAQEKRRKKNLYKRRSKKREGFESSGKKGQIRGKREGVIGRRKVSHVKRKCRKNWRTNGRTGCSSFVRNEEKDCWEEKKSEGLRQRGKGGGKETWISCEVYCTGEGKRKNWRHERGKGRGFSPRKKI